MDKNEQMFVHISIVFPVTSLSDAVDVEAKIKNHIAVIPEYRYDFQLAERKGDAGRRLDSKAGMS